MIGSHNSFSYLPPKNLWGKITKLWGRCQSLNLQDQYDKGVRCFDIRLRLIENEWHIVHNRIDYGDCNELGLINKLKSLCSNHDTVYFRFLLDERKTPVDPNCYTDIYLKYISNIVKIIPGIKIIQCGTFWNWRFFCFDDIVVKNTMEIWEYHASVSAKWYQYILGTKWYAKRHNSKNITKGMIKDKKVSVLIDYVEYQNN